MLRIIPSLALCVLCGCMMSQTAAITGQFDGRWSVLSPTGAELGEVVILGGRVLIWSTADDPGDGAVLSSQSSIVATDRVVWTFARKDAPEAGIILDVSLAADGTCTGLLTRSETRYPYPRSSVDPITLEPSAGPW